jgi:hypothetical protein
MRRFLATAISMRRQWFVSIVDPIPKSLLETFSSDPVLTCRTEIEVGCEVSDYLHSPAAAEWVFTQPGRNHGKSEFHVIFDHLRISIVFIFG